MLASRRPGCSREAGGECWFLSTDLHGRCCLKPSVSFLAEDISRHQARVSWPLTNVILQADLQFGPQHDESKGSVEVDIVSVVHPVLLAWKDQGDSETWETYHREGKEGQVLLPTKLRRVGSFLAEAGDRVRGGLYFLYVVPRGLEKIS